MEALQGESGNGYLLNVNSSFQRELNNSLNNKIETKEIDEEGYFIISSIIIAFPYILLSF